jgi:HK97 family phage portal protein
MGFFSQFAGFAPKAKRARVFAGESIARPISFLTPEKTTSGVTISPEESISGTTILQCVRRISNSCGIMPARVYRKSPASRRKDVASDHPLYRLLMRAPNPEMTPIVFKQRMFGSALVFGNSYAEIVRDRFGVAQELWPIHSRRVGVDRVKGQLVYIISDNNGRTVELPQESIFHFKGFAPWGLLGMTPLALNRDAVGLQKAQDDYAARSFANGVKPGVIIKHTGNPSVEERTRIREDWQAEYGATGQHRPAVISKGFEIETLGLTPIEVAMIEARNYSVLEVCRMFDMPPHMVADMARATWSNVEQMGAGFVTYTLGPWIVSFEQEIERSCLLPRERDEGLIYVRMNVDALLRADIKTRYAVYGTGRQWGILSVNDCRDMEDMNPIENGDIYLEPVNMTPAGTAGIVQDDPDPEQTPDPDKEAKSIGLIRGLIDLIDAQRSAHDNGFHTNGATNGHRA